MINELKKWIDYHMLSEYPGKPEDESLMDRIRLVEHEIICQSKEAFDKKMEEDNAGD